MPRRRLVIACGVLALAAATIWWWRADVKYAHQHDPQILAAARRYGVDPALVKAVVWKESRFNPVAQGRAGELGLMQLMDAAAQEWAESERVYPLPEAHLLDVRTNLLAGTWYLGKMLQRYRQTDVPEVFALADYNAGRGNVLKWAKGPAATNSTEFLAQMGFPDTRKYIAQVLEHRDKFRQDFLATPTGR